MKKDSKLQEFLNGLAKAFFDFSCIPEKLMRAGKNQKYFAILYKNCSYFQLDASDVWFLNQRNAFTCVQVSNDKQMLSNLPN